MRLIDADALMKDIDNDIFNTESRRGYEKLRVRKQPTIDAVPVVRCKDCKYRCSSEYCECRPDDAFCSDGEKMDLEVQK